MSGMGQGRSSAPGRRALPLQDVSDVPGEALRDILLLVGRDVPLGIIALWSDRERSVVAEWAGLAHLAASDNRVSVPREPWFVRVAAALASQVPAWDARLQALYDESTVINDHHLRALALAREVLDGLVAQVVVTTAAREGS